MKNETFLLECKNEIINDLNKYYESLRLEVDKKKLDIQTDQTNIKDESKYLNDQINKFLESNLNNINDYFDDFDQISLVNENVDIQIKEDIKKDAIKNYLICVKHSDYQEWGLFLEFEWYIDQNEQIFIEFE